MTALEAGAHVIIDLHNYARWSDQSIIGQGGPSNADVRRNVNLLIMALELTAEGIVC